MKRLIALGVVVALLISVALTGCASLIGHGIVLGEDLEVKVVIHTPTDTLVYREIPDFDDGEGIANAVFWYGYDSLDLVEDTILASEWDVEGEPLIRVVRDTTTGRLIYREIPDFVDGVGIATAVDLYGYEDIQVLEEVYLPLSTWAQETIWRVGENLPHSQHIGRLINVNVSLAKPLTVRRWYLGNTYDEQCLAAQSVVAMWIDDTLNINDWVIVSYIDEIPDTEELNLSIVVDKVYNSWS